MSPSEQYEGALKREQQVRAFQAHAGVAVVSLTVILAVNLLTNLSAGTAGDLSAWWSLWAIIGWIPGLGIHGLVVWLARPTNHAGDGGASNG